MFGKKKVQEPSKELTFPEAIGLTEEEAKEIHGFVGEAIMDPEVAKTSDIAIKCIGIVKDKYPKKKHEAAILFVGVFIGQFKEKEKNLMHTLASGLGGGGLMSMLAELAKSAEESNPDKEKSEDDGNENDKQDIF